MAGAAQMVLQYCVFNGSISIQDMEVQRRPYHKNCGCALHNLKGICPNSCPSQGQVSFPKATSWTTHASISITNSTNIPSNSCLLETLASGGPETRKL
ncbi:hypothetical protein G2W53_038647 [Senna tora]|uniref:Uncharacterized protein n=1 Tax=Senna tora TaxID=362788 RepID=A0A834SNL7_9FABA|nr:hypothetical protein G2W53_038647 [Senna tora]